MVSLIINIEKLISNMKKGELIPVDQFSYCV